jgi:hypothetical protein
MAKKRPTLMIPFNEEGMRTFKDVRSAISYFTKNGNVPQRRIVALFQSTFQIVSGKYSVNVIDLQKMDSESMKMFLIKNFKVKNNEAFERTFEVFAKGMDKWKNKFKVSDIKQEQVISE